MNEKLLDLYLNLNNDGSIDRFFLDFESWENAIDWYNVNDPDTFGKIHCMEDIINYLGEEYIFEYKGTIYSILYNEISCDIFRNTSFEESMLFRITGGFLLDNDLQPIVISPHDNKYELFTIYSESPTDGIQKHIDYIFIYDTKRNQVVNKYPLIGYKDLVGNYYDNNDNTKKIKQSIINQIVKYEIENEL